MGQLTGVERSRYNRNLLVEGFTEAMQYKLIHSSVLVIGAGGLGSAVISYLAAAGIGRIGIVEFDTVSDSNLQRQMLYDEGDLGWHKGEVAIRKIKSKNGKCEPILYNMMFTEENGISFAGGYDMIVDCTDNYAARYAIDAVSSRLLIPFVYGSAEQMSGQVSTFNYKGGRSYRDLYPTSSDEIKSGVGVLSPMPGIIGSMQALEVIKLLLDFSDNLSGRLLLFDGDSYQTTIFEV